MVVHYNVRWLPNSMVAICLGRHVFTGRAFVTQWALDHEEEHVRQYVQYGILPYLVRWFYWTWKYGYANNPFEIEAKRFADAQAARRYREAWGQYPWRRSADSAII